MINPIRHTRTLCLLIYLFLTAFSTGLAQSSDKEHNADGSVFENILIVSPSHGDVAVVETDEEIRFSIWISSFQPIKLVEITRKRDKEQGEEREDSRENSETIFFNKDEQPDTSWFVTFSFMPFVYSNDEEVKGFREERINVLVMTEDTKYEGDPFQKPPSKIRKEFIIRNKGQHSNEGEKNFGNAITDVEPIESEVGIVQRIPVLTVPKDRNLYYPVYFSIDSYSNLTKASSGEEKFSGLSPSLNAALIYQYDFGTFFSNQDKFRAVYLQSEKRFPGDMNSYDSTSESTYKYYEVSLSQLNLLLLSKFNQFDMEISLGQSVLQRYGEMQFFDSSKSDEENTTLSVAFGVNGLRQSSRPTQESRAVESKKQQEIQKKLEDKNLELKAKQLGYFVSGGYYIQNRKSITDENAIAASSGTSDSALIKEYLRSGTVSTLSVFGGYSFSIGELSGKIDQVDNKTDGSYMATTDQEMGVYWEMWFSTVDLFTGISMNTINYATARDEDNGTAISNTVTTWSVGSMVRITESMRLIIEFTGSSQESNISDYSYTDSIFSIAFGWTS
jgi:hypothetical protein